MSQYQQLLELRASKVAKLEAQVKTKKSQKSYLIFPALKFKFNLIFSASKFKSNLIFSASKFKSYFIFSASRLCTWHKYFQPLGTRPLGDRQCDWINYNGYNSDVMMLVKLKVIAVMRVEGLNTS